MLKVAVIGGGSTYTPELVNGFIMRVEQFPLDEFWLMDIDEERLKGGGWICPTYGGSKRFTLQSCSSPPISAKQSRTLPM